MNIFITSGVYCERALHPLQMRDGVRQKYSRENERTAIGSVVDISDEEGRI